MSFFVSARERRLWLCALAVAVAIYATLGLTGTLAEALGERGLDVVLFLLGMALVAATALAHGARARPRGAELAVIAGIAAVYLLLFMRLTLEERSHLVEYGVLAVFLHAALSERARHVPRLPRAPLLAIAATAALGLLDECLQLAIPARVFDPWDILFNALAGTLAVGAGLAVGWARGRG